jgi:transcriptional regulator GlxA family with amidase domain
VKWWNLRCYDGGDTNKPQDWRDAIIKRIPDFNTDRFILASDWSRFKNNQGKWHDLAGPLEAFQVASGFGGAGESRTTYECSVVSTRGGPLKTANGVQLVTESVRSLGRDPIDTLIVPGAFAVEDVTRDRGLVRWVRDRSPSCRRVCSVCIGSFLLAAAGVLDGRRAATHWLHAPLLAERHPGAAVEPDAIFVRDGAVWSSTGVTTGIDLALALIEQDAGRDLAMEVARILVVYLKRAAASRSTARCLAPKRNPPQGPSANWNVGSWSI